MPIGHTSILPSIIRTFFLNIGLESFFDKVSARFLIGSGNGSGPLDRYLGPLQVGMRFRRALSTGSKEAGYNDPNYGLMDVLISELGHNKGVDYVVFTYIWVSVRNPDGGYFTSSANRKFHHANILRIMFFGFMGQSET